MKKFSELRETVTVGSGAIAGTAEAGDDPPVRRKKDLNKMIRRSKFMQNEVFEVPAEIYNRTLRPKFNSERFSSLVGADEIGESIRQYAKKYPGKGILIQCENTGHMTWLRLPRVKRSN